MKSIRDVNQHVAQLHNFPEQQVAEANLEFWRLVRERLSNPEHEGVSVKYLGTWYTTPALTFKRIAFHLIQLRLALTTEKFKYSRERVIEESRTLIKRLWKLKNIMGWHFTAKGTMPTYQSPNDGKRRTKKAKSV